MRVAPRGADAADADEPTQRVTAEARLELGEVPELFLGLAQAPETLAGVWSLLRATLLRGKIPRTTKELIALVRAVCYRPQDKVIATITLECKAKKVKLLTKDFKKLLKKVKF